MAKKTAPYIGKTGKVDLDGDVFGEPFHMALVHEAVRAELNAKRRGTASTRTRAEVAMTGAKAFRQKGTGRARAGALSTPQRIGGGIAFGPKPRHFVAKVNRKARRRALRAILSEHARRGSLAIADPADFSAPSTKQAAGSFNGADNPGGILLVTAREGEETLVKSYRNISRVEVKPSNSVGVADIVKAGWLVLTPSALEYLTRIARKHREPATA